MTQLQQEKVDHIARETLLRFVDGECDSTEQSVVERHIAACRQCRDAMGRLQEVSTGLSSLLTEAAGNTPVAEWQPPLPRTGTPARRWGFATAATIGTLLLVSLSSPPLRAWITERLMGVIGSGTELHDDGAALQPEASNEVASGGNVLVFTPEGQAFTIELPAGARGRLEIVMNDRGAANTTVTEGASPEIIILPSGLRILADSTSESVYLVELPTSIETIQVRVGDERVATYEPGSLDGASSWTLQLPR